MTTDPRRRRRRWRWAAIAVLLPVILFGCNSTITPPPSPPDPTTVFLLSEALHTGIVLPPPNGNGEFVEFGFGDWSWFALGHDAWYNAFATVLWPTAAGLGRRTFGAHTAQQLRSIVSWAELSPLVVSATKAAALRQRLEAEFTAGLDHAVTRNDLGFVFVPADSSYWLPHNCADVAATWFEALDCNVGWAPFRRGLCVAD